MTDRRRITTYGQPPAAATYGRSPCGDPTRGCLAAMTTTQPANAENRHG